MLAHTHAPMHTLTRVAALQMLRDRGYVVEQGDIDMTFDDFKLRYACNGERKAAYACTPVTLGKSWYSQCCLAAQSCPTAACSTTFTSTKTKHVRIRIARCLLKPHSSVRTESLGLYYVNQPDKTSKIGVADIRLCV